MSIVKFRFHDVPEFRQNLVKLAGNAYFNNKKLEIMDYGEPYIYVDNNRFEKAYVGTDEWTLIQQRIAGIADTRRLASFLNNPIEFSNKISIVKGVFLGELHQSVIHEGPVVIDEETVTSTLLPGNIGVVVSIYTPDVEEGEPILIRNIKYAFINPQELNAAIAKKIFHYSIGKLVNRLGAYSLILFDL